MREQGKKGTNSERNLKFESDKNDLVPTKKIWTRPKQFLLVQNNLVGPKSPMQRQGISAQSQGTDPGLVCRLGGVRGAILYYHAVNCVASCRTCRLRSKKTILEIATSNLQN